MIDFFEKHPIIARFIYFLFGGVMLYGALMYGLLGLITGRTEIIARYHDNYFLENHWLVPVISFFALYIGLFLGIMLIALALGNRDVRKYYQNKILQTLFVISILGYLLVLVLYPSIYP